MQRGEFTNKESTIGLGCNACGEFEGSSSSSGTAEPTEPVELVTVALNSDRLRIIFFGKLIKAAPASIFVPFTKLTFVNGGNGLKVWRLIRVSVWISSHIGISDYIVMFESWSVPMGGWFFSWLRAESDSQNTSARWGSSLGLHKMMGVMGTD